MCLVLKLDNGKVVSIANEQTDRITEPSSIVLVYRFRSLLERPEVNIWVVFFHANYRYYNKNIKLLL